MIQSAVKCPSGHYTYFRNPSTVPGRLECDACGCEIDKNVHYASTVTCQQCNFDLCVDCQGLPQHEINRRSEASARNRQDQAFDACCMLMIATHADPITAAARGERYNGRRPNYRGQRVSTRDYPDATTYGWTFTGSCEGGRAEFFEKDFASHGIVKLDFYYTTGTVKTVLDHPRQGVTQLFAKGNSLSPEMYRAILQNPRHHTGNRYHTRR